MALSRERIQGARMRSVSSFSLVGVPNDDSESDSKGEALEISRRPKAGQQGGVRKGSAPPLNDDSESDRKAKRLSVARVGRGTGGRSPPAQ